MQTVVPILRYADARAAIRALCDGLGFVALFVEPAAGAFVRHARLKLGASVVIVGSLRPGETAFAAGAVALFVVAVDDLDAHCDRARAAGFTIDVPPRDTGFGTREYHARDAEGGRWIVGTRLAGPT